MIPFVEAHVDKQGKINRKMAKGSGFKQGGKPGGGKGHKKAGGTTPTKTGHGNRGGIGGRSPNKTKVLELCILKIRCGVYIWYILMHRLN